MRGKGCNKHNRAVIPRITGKRKAPNPGISALWDHPRTRGEKLSLQLLSAASLGSPPHTRGKEEGIPPVDAAVGITPAHAGKRCPPDISDTLPGDHPRTRGEKLMGRMGQLEEWGSPPHTRGKGGSSPSNGASDRITPAHAGKSVGHGSGIRGGRDHPRTRGEKGLDGIIKAGVKGSPPHTRGKVRQKDERLAKLRITPAHAGKSIMMWMLFKRLWDHPRTRGEKRRGELFPTLIIGSPPHTRGKVGIPKITQVCNGITPAHAGKRLNGSRF